MNNNSCTNHESIFCIGFILGAVFSYTGITGFVGGCILGAIMTKYVQLPTNTEREWIDVEKTTIVSSLFSQLTDRLTLLMSQSTT